jgi:hypothetical protein
MRLRAGAQSSLVFWNLHTRKMAQTRDGIPAEVCRQVWNSREAMRAESGITAGALSVLQACEYV